MKKLLCTMFLFISVSDGFSQVTNIDSFYLPGTVWVNCYYINGPLEPNASHFYSWSHTIERDSMINGQNYHLISGKDVRHYNAPVNNDFGIFGGVRVNGRKVYFLFFGPVSTQNSFSIPGGLQNWQQRLNSSNTLGAERILYDFDLQEGDTFAFGTIYAIDSVVLQNGVYAKRYQRSNTSVDPHWIEGVGGSQGAPLYPTHPDFYHHSSICYHSPAMGFTYPNSNTNCDAFTTGLEEIENRHDRILIYPNPINGDILQFETNKNVSIIRFADISGKICGQYIISSGQNSIHTSLSPGIYFLKVVYKDGSTETQKLIKQ